MADTRVRVQVAVNPSAVARMARTRVNDEGTVTDPEAWELFWAGDMPVLLRFVDPCPYCRKRHVHGNPRPDPDPDGTYGARTPHCHGGPSYTLVPETEQ